MARTPSASAHQKVLVAALKLVAERGVDAASMDAIAEEAGVSKATIYKHWNDKDALLIETMAELAGVHSRPKFDTGNIQADLVAILSYQPKEHSEFRERAMPHFIAYSSRNPEFGSAWRNRVMDPPRKEIRHLLQLAVRKGDLESDLDVDLSIVLLLGPMMYWYIFLRQPAPDSSHLAWSVVKSFWRSFSKSVAAKAPSKTAKS